MLLIVNFCSGPRWCPHLTDDWLDLVASISRERLFSIGPTLLGYLLWFPGYLWVPTVGSTCSHPLSVMRQQSYILPPIHSSGFVRFTMDFSLRFGCLRAIHSSALSSIVVMGLRDWLAFVFLPSGRAPLVHLYD